MDEKKSKPNNRAAPKPNAPLPDQYLVLIECRSEDQQLELLERFLVEGLKCRALLA